MGKVADELIPIKIWINNRENKTLWECDLSMLKQEGYSFYLCWEDGNHYVIRYNPKGAFEMFTVDESGNEIIKCEFAASSEKERKIFQNTWSHILRKQICLLV